MKNAFVCLPSNEDLALMIDEAVNENGVGEQVTMILDTYPDAFALHVITNIVGKPEHVTRDTVVRRMLRSLNADLAPTATAEPSSDISACGVTASPISYRALTESQCKTIEDLLEEHHLLWDPAVWSVLDAMEQRVKHLASALEYLDDAEREEFQAAAAAG